MRDPIPGQHRVTTAPVTVEDWKGRYTLDAGQGFTVEEPSPDDPQTVCIERDGILSGSMGGSMSLDDLRAHTRAD